MVNKGEMCIDFDTYDFIRRRAESPILHRFGVNRLELWLLSALSGYTRFRQRKIVSKELFFQTITRNGLAHRKHEGAFHGLLRHGLIHTYEYVSRPGSLSISISSAGTVVLEAYQREVKALEVKFAGFEAKEPQARYWKSA